MSHTTAAHSSRLGALFLVLVVLPYAVAAHAQQLSPAEQQPVKPLAATIVGSITDAEDAIIHTLMMSEKSPTAKSGTGFFISPTGYLLTAAHNLNSDQPDARPFAYTKDGKAVPLSVLKIDTELDVAVLFAPIPIRKYFALSDNALAEVGKRVTFGGFPDPYSEQRGIPPVSFRGAGVSAVDTVSMGSTGITRQIIKLDQASNPGHSGGPVFSDESFAVIGVMRATVTGPSPMPPNSGVRQYQGFALVTPIAYVRPLVSDLQNLAVFSEPPEAGTALRWYKTRLRQELLDHLDVVHANKQLFKGNIESIEKGAGEYLMPPARYRREAWSVVREDPRAETVLGKERMAALRSYYFEVGRHQDLLEARESVRLGQWALSSRSSLLKDHDKALLEQANSVENAAIILLKKLDNEKE